MPTDPNPEISPELLLAEDEAAAFAEMIFGPPATAVVGAETVVDLTEGEPLLDLRSDPPPDGAVPVSPPQRREGDSLFPDRTGETVSLSRRSGGALFGEARPKKLERTVPEGGLFATHGLPRSGPVTVEFVPIQNETRPRWRAPWIWVGIGTLAVVAIVLFLRLGGNGSETEAVGSDVSLIPATVVTSPSVVTSPPTTPAPSTTRPETTPPPTTAVSTTEAPDEVSTTGAPAVTQAPTTRRPRPTTTRRPRPASTAPASTAAPTTAAPQTLPPEVTVEGLAPPTWQATTAPPTTAAG